MLRQPFAFACSPKLLKYRSSVGCCAAVRALAAAAVVLTLAACGGGLGSSSPAGPPAVWTGADIAVLIAQGDATSEAIGLAYQQARNVPEANMIRLAVPRGSDAISAANFTALKATLDARLPATVQGTLVTWMQPSRVVGTCSMGLTSALAFGYDARYCGLCSTTTESPYYNHDTRKPFTDLKLRPSMMLGAATLADAQALINRGVAADRSFASGGATGQAFLVRTNDATRSVRFGDFQALASASVKGLTMRYVDNSAGGGSNIISGQNDVMFYFTGLFAVPQINSNRYLPGAVADHLTSVGGYLPNLGGQMPATDWLLAGATASFGTVEEPCSFSEKFPRASVLLRHYAGGESLIEAYWKSVQWPGQGLFVGEPLARPWSP